MSTPDDRIPGDPETAPTVGSADADADAERAGAGGGDPDLGVVPTLRLDDAEENERVDSDGVPTGRADADEDARQAGAD